MKLSYVLLVPLVLLVPTGLLTVLVSCAVMDSPIICSLRITLVALLANVGSQVLVDVCVVTDIGLGSLHLELVDRCAQKMDQLIPNVTVAVVESIGDPVS